MKKIGVIIAVSAIAAVTGCKDPAYRSNRISAQNEAKDVEAAPTAGTAQEPVATPEKQPEPVAEEKPIVEEKPVVEEKPAPEPEPEYTIYIVQRGDYLAKISKRYNITINSIKKLNPSLKNDTIRIGQKLKLPGKIDVGEQKEPEKTAKASASSSGKFTPYTGATTEYTVKAGDTLGAIAYGNGINIRQLKDLNKLTSDNLKIGQKLKIPAGKAAAEKKPTPVKDEAKPVSTPAVAKEEPAPVVATPEEPQDVAVDAPADDTAPVTDTVDAAEPAPLTYVVQEGDDVTGVSIHWGVSAASIRELNNLGENDQLEPGQIIKLPADAQQ